MIAISVVVVSGFGSVSGAAAKPKPVLRVAPAKPTVKTPITVSLKAPRLKRPGVHYGAALMIGNLSGPTCTGNLGPVALRRARGGTFTATLTPQKGDPGAPQWCDGAAQLVIRRYGPGGLYSHPLARRDFPVGLGKGNTVSPVADVPVKITVLGGSTLTASAAGRPDRSAQLSGVLRGAIPGRFKPNTDIQVGGISGSLTPLTSGLAQAVFPPDPLCPDTPPPGTFDAVPASSQMALLASGDATFSLTLNGTPSQLFGCGPAGALNGTTPLPLSGHVGPKGLLELGLTGNVAGIALPSGSQGGLAASLVLNVDLSGLS